MDTIMSDVSTSNGRGFIPDDGIRLKLQSLDGQMFHLAHFVPEVSRKLDETLLSVNPDLCWAVQSDGFQLPFDAHGFTLLPHDIHQGSTYLQDTLAILELLPRFCCFENDSPGLWPEDMYERDKKPLALKYLQDHQNADALVVCTRFEVSPSGAEFVQQFGSEEATPERFYFGVREVGILLLSHQDWLNQGNWTIVCAGDICRPPASETGTYFPVFQCVHGHLKFQMSYVPFVDTPCYAISGFVFPLPEH